MGSRRSARGGVVATATLVECHTVGDYFLDNLDELEVVFGNYAPNRYAWELQDVQRLAEAIPAKGMQGLWDWER